MIKVWYHDGAAYLTPHYATPTALRFSAEKIFLFFLIFHLTLYKLYVNI